MRPSVLEGTVAPRAADAVADRHARLSAMPRLISAQAMTCAVMVVYLGLGLLAFWPVQPLSTSSLPSCGCSDVVQQVWFLSWIAHALSHGLNPFFSHTVNVPKGVNLASNPSVPLLGLIGAPITLTAGPVAAYNALIRLALFSSAAAMYGVLRHYRARRLLSFVGGLLYGFSPYMIEQAKLHLNLAFITLLPLMAVAVDELFVREGRSPRRAGLLLGLLVAGQYLISPEILFDFVVVATVCLAFLAARRPHDALRRLRRIGAGLLWACGPLVVLAGYPIAYGIAGPNAIAGNSVLASANEGIRNDLLSPVVPTATQLIGSSGWKTLGSNLVGGIGENGGYLGVPLLCGWACTTAWAMWRRRATPVLLSVAAVVAFVFSLGASLQVHGRDAGLGLPFRILSHVPLAEISVPARYSAIVSLGVVMSTVLAVESFSSSLRRHRVQRAVRALPIVGAVVFGAATFLFLLPSGPVASAAVHVPAYFTSSEVDAIDSGSNVLVFPYPIQEYDFSMLWQIESGFRFDLLGGNVLTPVQGHLPPGAGAGGGYIPTTLAPAVVQELFYAANGSPSWNGNPTLKGTVPLIDGRPSPQPWVVRDVRLFLRRYHVDTVIVDPLPYPAVDAQGSPLASDPAYGPDHHPVAVVDTLEALLGQPVHGGPLLVWYHADRSG